MAGQGSEVSNLSTNYINVPYDYRVVMYVLGATDPRLRPRTCPYCEKSFRNSQALGGHLSTHRTRTKKATQRQNVNKARNRSRKVTAAPRDHAQMVNKRGFNWLGECHAGRKTPRRTTPAPATGFQKLEGSPQLVDYMGIWKHGEGPKNYFDVPTPGSKLMPVAKFMQEEEVASNMVSCSSDGIDLTLRL